MAEETEVRTKLVFDDNQATKALKNLDKGFDDVTKAEKEAAGGAKAFATQVAAIAAGNALVPMAKSAAAMAGSMFTVANNAFDTQQGLAATFATMEDVPWEKSRQQAERLYSSMQDMAIGVGQDFADVEGAMATLMSRMGKSADDVPKLEDDLKKLTVIANVSGASAQSLAMDFSLMHEGMLKTNGALFQGMQRMGLFGDDVRVAKQEFMKMDPAARTALASKGLEMLSSRMAKAAPTFTDLVTSMKGMVGAFQESFGAPVVRALIPVMKDLQTVMKDSREDIEELAESVGKDLAGFAKDGVRELTKGIKYLRDNSEGIKKAIIEGSKSLYKAAKFVVDNKNVFMAMAAGKMAQGMGAGKVVGAAASSGSAMAGGAGIKGALGAAGGVAALSAAVAGLGLASQQASKLMSATNGEAGKWFEDNIERGVMGKQLRSLEDLFKSSDRSYDLAAKKEAALRAIQEKRYGDAEKLAKQMTALGDSGAGAKISGKAGKGRASDLAKETEEMSALYRVAILDGQEGVVLAYNQAKDSGNVAAQQFAAAMLLDGTWTQQSLEDSSIKLKGGMDILALRAEEGASTLKRIVDLIPTINAAEMFAKAGKKAKTSISIGKVVVKQTFKSADPDNIALVFKRDLARVAVRKTQSRRASPFGV